MQAGAAGELVCESVPSQPLSLKVREEDKKQEHLVCIGFPCHRNTDWRKGRAGCFSFSAGCQLFIRRSKRKISNIHCTKVNEKKKKLITVNI